MGQRRRAAATAPGGPAKPDAGLPSELKPGPTKQAAQKAQEAYKALLKARVTHLEATKVLLVALKEDLKKGVQDKQHSSVKAETSKGKGPSSHPFVAGGHTPAGHAGTEFTKGTPIPAGVKEILDAVGSYSGGFSTTAGGISYGKSEGNAKQAGVGKSNEVFAPPHPISVEGEGLQGDLDFNDVVLKLDAEIQGVQNKLISLPNPSGSYADF